MNNKAHIKNSRQKRALEALLANVFIQVKDIGPHIGALNPRQTIMELRRQGFQDIIRTRRLKVRDRDGKRCSPGGYYIPEELKHLAREALTKYTAIASVNSRAAEQGTNNHTRGV